MPVEEAPVVMRNDDVSVRPHPAVSSHDTLHVEECAHRPVELDVLVERHKVARNADPPHVSLKQDNLGAWAVPAEAMDRHSISDRHVAVDELEPVADVEQVEGKLGIVVKGHGGGLIASGN